ncbi:uncharacterized protein LOC129590254 [Paramacrobiotus metropolitanus]|uniref:uncharacterized protein LOC129590254 n=1 Tax=Paramacrobiotus metropolitanus TaxID=2943436 RepID=UPI002445D2AA|nr:uncharacterized protein LOC129590254 [Paramacrobiotus metropolitanus]
MANKEQMDMLESMWRLKEEVAKKRETTPKSQLKCVNCQHHPTVFHSDNAKKEFEEISQLCGACWEVITLPPDADEYEVENAKEILRLQSREFHHNPRGWTCLTCQKRMNHRFMHDKCSCLSS